MSLSALLSTIYFECGAVRIPYDIDSSSNSKPIILNLQNIGNSYRLVISSVVEKDYGDYSCRASNPLEEEVSQKIVVTGKS
jgi:hypothetical protein